MSSGRRQKAPLAQSLLVALLHDWQLQATSMLSLSLSLSLFCSSRCTFIALIKSRESYRVLSAVLASESIYEIRLGLFAFTSASDYIESSALCAFFIFIILHACHKMWHIALWYGSTRYAHSSAWHMTESKHKGFHLCKCLDGSIPLPQCVVRIGCVEAPGSHSNWNFCAVCSLQSQWADDNFSLPGRRDKCNLNCMKTLRGNEGKDSFDSPACLPAKQRKLPAAAWQRLLIGKAKAEGAYNI